MREEARKMSRIGCLLNDLELSVYRPQDEGGEREGKIYSMNGNNSTSERDSVDNRDRSGLLTIVDQAL